MKRTIAILIHKVVDVDVSSGTSIGLYSAEVQQMKSDLEMQGYTVDNVASLPENHVPKPRSII